jgi:PAS domain-containing protein
LCGQRGPRHCATVVIEANLDFARQFGRSPSEICGSSFCELLHPSIRDKVQRQFARLAHRQRARFDERVAAVRPDQTMFSGELTGIAVNGEAGRVESIIVLVRPEESQSGDYLLTGRTKVLTEMDARVLEGVAAGGRIRWVSSASVPGRPECCPTS